MKKLTRAEATVVALSAGTAVVVWAAARAAGIDLAVKSGDGTSHVNVVSVLVTALVVSVAAIGLLRVLERRTTNGRRTWTIVALAVWVVSLLGPLSATRPSAGLALASLHLLVGAIVVGGLRQAHAVDRTRVA
jgi:hypothetical protein